MGSIRWPQSPNASHLSTWLTKKQKHLLREDSVAGYFKEYIDDLEKQWPNDAMAFLKAWFVLTYQKHGVREIQRLKGQHHRWRHLRIPPDIGDQIAEGPGAWGRLNGTPTPDDSAKPGSPSSEPKMLWWQEKRKYSPVRPRSNKTGYLSRCPQKGVATKAGGILRKDNDGSMEEDRSGVINKEWDSDNFTTDTDAERQKRWS
ncbi:MAG: hypothetical protein Q9182_004955 [Xanthomendoza sp. 2 TL-2023]